MRTFNCGNDATLALRTTSKIIKLSFTREKFEFSFWDFSRQLMPQSSGKIELKNIRLLDLNFFICATSAV